MNFAKITFRIAGAWGVLVLVPLYFMIGTIGKQTPPAITHPEFYYGFIGVALVWQLAFFVIGSDPARYRPMMAPAILEKFGHVIAMFVLYLQGSMNLRQLAFNLPDLLLGVLFTISFVKTAGARADTFSKIPV
jgi:hypothetical protein